MFKKKNSSFHVRDELVLSPIIAQEIIDHGIILYIGE
jgi:hypothetical protein